MPFNTYLFNIYLEHLVKNCFQNMGGVIVGGRINCIRFAYDMTLLAEEEMMLRDMLLELNDSCEQYGMKINANKTKTTFIERKVKKLIPVQRVRLTRTRHRRFLRHKQVKLRSSSTTGIGAYNSDTTEVEQQVNIRRFNIPKLKNKETKQHYQIEISDRFATLGSSDEIEEELDINSV
ncbi:hypothetical protein ANN_04305 [Periplaneta americana]|uniref:Reverse transcriptase domain-containing protein n=1 Tax=Periplaneta americana TaxID=6978 RepID=A0ABQ8T9R7_PERAM|nr:hypothetical protein ANN_04305 [Periplaneta americana]